MKTYLEATHSAVKAGNWCSFAVSFLAVAKTAKYYRKEPLVCASGAVQFMWQLFWTFFYFFTFSFCQEVFSANFYHVHELTAMYVTCFVFWFDAFLLFWN